MHLLLSSVMYISERVRLIWALETSILLGLLGFVGIFDHAEDASQLITVIHLARNSHIHAIRKPQNHGRFDWTSKMPPAPYKVS